MALQIHVAGPGVDVTRRLEAGEPALILGRDSDCAICLPDAERNVSRRHLSLWNDGDLLQFHVLSVVNGVQTPAGELPPGARGVLAAGEVLSLSAFRITAALATQDEQTGPASVDAWANLQSAAELLDSVEGTTRPETPAEEDPFGDWGFQTTFGPGAPGGSLRAEALAPAPDLESFFEGLGVHGATHAGLTRGELQTIGRITRIAVQALLQASEAAAATRRDTRAGEPTPAERSELHPLRLDTPIETRLEYLFGGAAASGGFVPPDRAMAQVAAELVAHEQAMGQAVQEAIRGVLADFEPEALRKRLPGSGRRLFGAARAWEAFARDYAERAAAEPAWVHQLLDRHFARAYARALLRAKRNTGGRPDG
ncbi:type VI secretion system-associated FHA domain protein [Ramlibacter alkalitolerans]|uniref:FHA domain-containing protein n=1 Tax=Ramlibacter alkalitolerans TaxID=2039631 RepID=A0ABS1JWV6_9BURK|nr:type VI secretion system-associated FHA domain protein [Ramlibacter alkalitolerans]MBL0428800.1 FHA domain-containing protein [Ramlibacter alkalitolerans]